MVFLTQTQQIPTLKQAIESYRMERVARYTIQMNAFERHFALTDTARQQAIRAVTWMELGLPLQRQHESYLLHQHLMYISSEKGIIKPINCIARDVIISHWKRSLEEAMYQAIDNVLENGTWSNDVKGRAVEKYMIMQIEKEKRLKFLNMVRIDTTKDPEDWGLEELSINNLTVQHFRDARQLG